MKRVSFAENLVTVIPPRARGFEACLHVGSLIRSPKRVSFSENLVTVYPLEDVRLKKDNERKRVVASAKDGFPEKSLVEGSVLKDSMGSERGSRSVERYGEESMNSCSQRKEQVGGMVPQFDFYGFDFSSCISRYKAEMAGSPAPCSTFKSMKSPLVTSMDSTMIYMDWATIKRMFGAWRVFDVMPQQGFAFDMRLFRYLLASRFCLQDSFTILKASIVNTTVKPVGSNAARVCGCSKVQAKVMKGLSSDSAHINNGIPVMLLHFFGVISYQSLECKILWDYIMGPDSNVDCTKQLVYSVLERFLDKIALQIMWPDLEIQVVIYKLRNEDGLTMSLLIKMSLVYIQGLKGVCGLVEKNGGQCVFVGLQLRSAYGDTWSSPCALVNEIQVLVQVLHLRWDDHNLQIGHVFLLEKKGWVTCFHGFLNYLLMGHSK